MISPAASSGNEPTAARTVRRVLALLILILAGEVIFGLPFHIPRYFRPTYVSVFDVSQTELGLLGSIYGVVAMASYLGGGVVADRYSPRVLISLSLLATGAGGLYLATIPPFAGLAGLFAFWGASTILLFWCPLIRATRAIGGDQRQGVAFGILEGGRGLFAALLAMLALSLFAAFLPEAHSAINPEQRRSALQSTIYVYSVGCAVIAAMVWCFLPDAKVSNQQCAPAVDRLMTVLRMPQVRLQATIIIAAYCTFKGIDFYSQYAHDVWGWSEVEAARLSALSGWMRPFAAIGAGLLADEAKAWRVVALCFACTLTAYISFLVVSPSSAAAWLLWANVLLGGVGLFGLRGVYFALLEESNTPRHLTGTAVGVISFIGFTPEIIVPPLGGWLIDHWSEPATGFNILFVLLGMCSTIGIIATLLLHRVVCRNAPASSHGR